jgi:hypothetical protein
MTNSKVEGKEKCFVIMPISDPNNYNQGHFKKIYEQIFIPAIENAGYLPHRVDDDKSSHLIHSSIIKELIDAPMVLCDLSSRNPNVLYELGIRHAFGKPVVLVQEIGTENIFDINGINTVSYHPARVYEEVLDDQAQISTAIKATKENQRNYSLTQLVKISSANIPNGEISNDDRITVALSSMQNELWSIRKQLQDINDRENLGINYLANRFNQTDKKQMLDNNIFDYNQLIEVLNKSNDHISRELIDDAVTKNKYRQEFSSIQNERNKRDIDKR